MDIMGTSGVVLVNIQEGVFIVRYVLFLSLLWPLQAVEAGAEILCGGGPPPDADAASTDRTPGKGYYVSPTVLSGVKEGDEAWEEEIFGPVLCVMKFEEESEAVKLANRSQYGLAAAVMSADKDR